MTDKPREPYPDQAAIGQTSDASAICRHCRPRKPTLRSSRSGSVEYRSIRSGPQDERNTPVAGQSSQPLRVVFLSDWLSFPNGMAATNRVRLLARAMTEAGARAHVMCLQASDRPPVIENPATRGEWHGVSFEYTCGTTVRHSSFLMRRLIEMRGWLGGVIRLVQLRRTGQLDCVYLWFTCQRAQLRRAAFTVLLHALHVPVLMELNERPWSLRDDQSAIERMVSPLAGMHGAVSISSYLTSWAQAEAAHRVPPPRIVEVPVLVDMAEQPAPREPSTDQLTIVFAGAPSTTTPSTSSSTPWNASGPSFRPAVL